MPIRPFRQYLPQIGARTYVDDNAVIIGQVIIGEDSSIWPFASIRGDMQAITIGSRTSIQDGCVLHVVHDSTYHPSGIALSVGSDVTVGHKATLHACTIHDRCLIGMDSVVLDGAIVESDVILGAKSVVSPGKILESGYLWLGSPAIKKRPLTQEELAFIRHSAQNYVLLKNQYAK
jgi:carbonic anhydrase/acetyltransferase-like protein (isoleucine patch superfamily)